MSSDRQLSDALGIDVNPAEIPTDRKRVGVDADQDTLLAEISLVIERHQGPVTPAKIVQTLFDIADSYAAVHDVPMETEEVTDPNEQEVVVVRFPGTDLHPAPIGKWTGEGDIADRTGRIARGGPSV
ncbi:hypothetical protein [Natrinema pallidum]|uniref:hypothetical protein n=1 Tax=Natrinema pallidum TaxID=69527 RepID=UPI0037525A4A